MTMEAPGRPLQQVWRQGLPQPGPGQVRIRVVACGVCRTDLHIVVGELPWPGHAGARGACPPRRGGTAAQSLALGTGLAWAGDAGQPPPRPLDGALLFAPVGALVPEASRAVHSGGTVVGAGIHMCDIPSFPCA